MTKIYKVYQCHSPSGGVSPVDETQYDTLAEASGVAKAMTGEVSEFVTYNVDGKEYEYPFYFPQALRKEDGMWFMELE